MKENISVRLLLPIEKIPYDLLLLADETEDAINKYIHHSEIYVCEQHNQIIGTYALQLINKDSAEIKNIAIAVPFQGKGIGTFLLEHATEMTTKRGLQFLLIGTAAISKNTINLYQKAGFKNYQVLEDFYIHNYAEPIYENGMQLRDMILLKKDLKQ